MNQRMKWDAEAAFKRDEIRLSLSDARERDGEGPRAGFAADAWRRLNILRDNPSVVIKHRPGWTPAHDPRAYMKAEPDVYKGRDYDAILRAAKKPPVGYYEDAPTGIKFGGQPLPSATTNPHGKDVDTADGPWPKCLLSNCGTGVIVYADDGDDGTFCGTHGERWKFSKRYTAALTEIPLPKLKKREPLLIADAIRRLEQNGHADVAAELRGKAINSY